MREYTEPTPIDVQAFSAGRILKESWEICTKYFGALVMPTFMIIIGLGIATHLADLLTDLNTGPFIINFGIIIAAMAVQKSVVELKRTGAEPRFADALRAGLASWGRGIAVNFVIIIGLIPTYIAMILIIFPGVYLWASTKRPYAGLLLWAGLFGSVYIGQWFMTRICLMSPASADSRNTVGEAVKSGWFTSKQNIEKVRRVWLNLLVISICTLMVFALAYGMLVGTKSCSGDVALGILSIPAALCGALLACIYWTSMSLTYQALKPAPKEENQLPGAN